MVTLQCNLPVKECAQTFTCTRMRIYMYIYVNARMHVSSPLRDTCTHTRANTYAHTVHRHTRPMKHARDGRQVLRAPLATSPAWPYPFSSPTPSYSTNVTTTYEDASTFKGRFVLILTMEILLYLSLKKSIVLIDRSPPFR